MTRTPALTLHAVLIGWSVAVLFSATYLLTEPADEVIRRGVVVIVVVVALSAVLSILSAGPSVRIPVLVVGTIAATTAVVYPASRRDGRSHLEAFSDDLAGLAVALRRDVPPIAVEPLWGAIVIILIAVVTLTTVILAIDAIGTFEVLIPGTAFVVIVLTAATSDPPLYSAILIALGVIVLAVATARRPRRGRPISASDRVTRVPAVLGLAVVVALVGVAAGPLVPGAGSEAVIDLRARSTGVTTILSPLVDIRSRLTSSSDEVMFTVVADTESYWRIASLPEFDGRTFRLAAAPLSLPPRTDRSTASLRQTIDIVGLGGRLVPAAPDPIILSDGLRWNSDTDAVVLVDRDLRPDDDFEIVSIRPQRDARRLGAATTVAAPAMTRALPDGFPKRILDIAREVTAEASNDYERALALQFWFREQFEYSLDTPAGHGIDSIERFLVVRRGYCEQFAAAYAAMGRGIGLSTRVAVGFTSGIVTDGRFEVLGRHAHAWPEVWFDGFGWVPFEPTPGRGAPGAEQYTGVAPQQDSPEPTAETPGDDDRPEDEPIGGDDGFGLVIPSDLDPPSPTPTIEDAATGGSIAVFALVVLGLVAIGLAPIARRRLNRYRWSRSSSHEQILELWDSTRRTLRRAGIDGRASTTTQEWAMMARRAVPSIDRPITALAEAVDRTIFSRQPEVDVGIYGMSVGRASMSWWRQVHAFVAAERGLRWRFTDYWVRRL